MAEIQRGNGGKFVKKSVGFTGNLEAASANDGGESIADSSGPTVINPAEIAGAGNAAGSNAPDGSEQKRSRGRQPGYSPKKEAEKTLHIDGLSAILFSVHTMLAGIASAPELALTEDESKKMAKAAADVAKHYNFNATEKQMAWINLTLCCGSIYGSKFFAYSARSKSDVKEKNKTKANGAAAPQSNNVAAPSISFPDLTPMPN